MQNESLVCINLLNILCQPVLNARGDWSGPGETVFIRDSVFQREVLFDHGEGREVMVLHGIEGFFSIARNRLGIRIDCQRLCRGTVVHPHQITACALRHSANEWAVSLSRFVKQSRHVFTKQSVIVRRDGLRAKVVLRVIRQDCERSTSEAL